ncbi:MAG TPA: leucyl aminopeptidase [Solirubrobacteraceae bacterium]|nr:leucyl aminopeptidase [Solirubrobacteraceae bacterium]
MQVQATAKPAQDTDADTLVVCLCEGEPPPAGAPAELAELLASGEARRTPKALALAHAQGRRWLILGMGPRETLTPERARVAAAAAHPRALELSCRSLAVQPPAGASSEVAEALVEGFVLADYRYERNKSKAAVTQHTGAGDAADGAAGGAAGASAADPEPPKQLERLIVAAPDVSFQNGGPARARAHARGPLQSESQPGSPEGGSGEAAAGEDEGRLETCVSRASTVAHAVNDARDLQNRPGNDLTPTALAEYAVELAAAIPDLTAQVEGRADIQARGMGAFAAVAQGSAQEPALIVLRYDPDPPSQPAGGSGTDESQAGEPGTGGPPILGFVGKAVTFDSGGISIKPGAKMSEMKFDMSGGAAVVQAMAAIARLKLPVKVIAVVGATENLPDGRAVKPGDIVTAANGRTIEINNTDAEGRLVLADCLCRAVELGAQRIIDLATLTGAVIVALGSTYAGLMSNDEDFAERILAAGRATGEIAWRLPLHEEYHELIKGAYADLDNAPEARKAGTIVGGAFLSNFVADVPWAHLDIAGSAWDLGRGYAPKGASGYGVRLLVALAESYCS